MAKKRKVDQVNQNLNKKLQRTDNYYETADELLGKPEIETNVKQQVNNPKKRKS